MYVVILVSKYLMMKTSAIKANAMVIKIKRYSISPAPISFTGSAI